jgi:hypothetical protein
MRGVEAMNFHQATVVILITIAAPALAQTVSPAKARPTVTKAFDIIESVPERISVGAPAAFQRRTTAGIEDFLRDGVIVRIFSLRPGEERPEPLDGMRVNDCDVYLAVVHRLVLSGTRDLRFESVITLDQEWLSVSNSGETIEPGHYFLVFERPGQAEVMTDYFRIQKDDAKSYFDTGFKMTILADNPRLKAQDLVRKFRERSNRIGDLKERLDKTKASIPCFSYEPLKIRKAATDQFSDGELVACSTEVSATPVGI